MKFDYRKLERVKSCILNLAKFIFIQINNLFARVLAAKRQFWLVCFTHTAGHGRFNSLAQEVIWLYKDIQFEKVGLVYFTPTKITSCFLAKGDSILSVHYARFFTRTNFSKNMAIKKLYTSFRILKFELGWHIRIQFYSCGFFFIIRHKTGIIGKFNYEILEFKSSHVNTNRRKV